LFLDIKPDQGECYQPLMKYATELIFTLGMVFAAGVNLVSCAKHQTRDPISKPMSIATEVIYQSQQCNIAQPQAQWISTQSQLQSLFKELRKHILSDQAMPPAIDFSQFGGVLVAMGRKNTGGYGLTLIDEGALLDNGVLQFTLQWQQPKPGMIVTQALTSPCLLIKVTKGNYQRIEIKDQTGVTRLQVPLTGF
jgi:hypothetical protein